MEDRWSCPSVAGAERHGLAGRGADHVPIGLRGGGEEVGDAGAERGGQALERGDRWFGLAALDLADDRGRDLGALRQGSNGESVFCPQASQPRPDRLQIGGLVQRFCHRNLRNGLIRRIHQLQSWLAANVQFHAQPIVSILTCPLGDFDQSWRRKFLIHWDFRRQRSSAGDAELELIPQVDALAEVLHRLEELESLEEVLAAGSGRNQRGVQGFLVQAGRDRFR